MPLHKSKNLHSKKTCHNFAVTKVSQIITTTKCNMKKFILPVLTASVFLLTGCMTNKDASPDDPSMNGGNQKDEKNHNWIDTLRPPLMPYGIEMTESLKYNTLPYNDIYDQATVKGVEETKDK